MNWLFAVAGRGGAGGSGAAGVGAAGVGSAVGSAAGSSLASAGLWAWSESCSGPIGAGRDSGSPSAAGDGEEDLAVGFAEFARAEPASALSTARVNPNQRTKEDPNVEWLKETILNKLGIAKRQM
jgi:hypothetical protein